MRRTTGEIRPAGMVTGDRLGMPVQAAPIDRTTATVVLADRGVEPCFPFAALIPVAASLLSQVL